MSSGIAWYGQYLLRGQKFEHDGQVCATGFRELGDTRRQFFCDVKLNPAREHPLDIVIASRIKVEVLDK